MSTCIMLTYYWNMGDISQAATAPLLQIDKNNTLLDWFNLHHQLCTDWVGAQGSVKLSQSVYKQTDKAPKKYKRERTKENRFLEKKFRAIKAAVGSLYTEAVGCRSLPILWFTDAMKGSPSYVNGGSAGEIYFSSMGGVWEKHDKVVEGLTSQSLTEICHFFSAEEKANEAADFEGKVCKSHIWDEQQNFVTIFPDADTQMNWSKAEAFRIAYAQPRIMISANTSIHNK
ncbi:hypothetical protein HELRODRAFT_172472 [Helobdella robusta]|uniref:Uncharacterized protein n=1 Tax=Helobdella robusta TaxID=6412 RepID=T1F5D2_HELRO|nr:hypothetical protein HELRODRAFT_172472 [Helobdella robusta]ESO04798.1 hypothetical protein HELRODRAFT_172472 [Helobdella robusta]